MDQAVTDGTLVERAVLGDPAAFGGLLERHVDAVHDHLVRASGDAMAGLELTSDVWAAAMRDLGLLADPESFRTWVLGRAARRGMTTGGGGEITIGAGGSEATMLGPRTFAVLDLVTRHGLSIREVAAVLGMGRGTVERELDRAGDRLSAAGLSETYGALPLVAAPAGYAARLWEHLHPRWSTTPPAPVRARPLRDPRVVIALVTAAAMLLLSVPVAVGLRDDRAGLSVLQAAPYTPPPATPSPTPTAAEDIVLPAPPAPEPEPEPTPEPTPEPRATPTPQPSEERTEPPVTEEPTENETPTEDCELIVLGCTSPSEPSQPSETETRAEPSPSPSPERADEPSPRP